MHPATSDHAIDGTLDRHLDRVAFVVPAGRHLFSSVHHITLHRRGGGTHNTSMPPKIKTSQQVKLEKETFNE